MSFYQFAISLLAIHRRRIAVALVALALLSAVSVVPPMLFAWLIDRVIGEGRDDLLLPLIAGFLAVPLAVLVLRAAADYSVALIAQRVLFDLRLELYRRVQRLSCRYLNATPTGQIMERLRGDVNQVQAILSNQTLFLVVQAVYGLFAMVIMAWISLWLTGVVLVAAVGYLASYDAFVRRIRAVQRRHRRRMDRLSSRAQEKLAGQVVIKSFGHERREARGFLRENFITQRVYYRFRVLNMAYGEVSKFLAIGSRLVILLAGAWLVIQGRMSFGMLLAFQTYAQTVLQPVVQLAELSNQLQQAKISLLRIFEQIQAEPDVLDDGGRRLPAIRGEVRFDQVHFAYEEGKPVLRGLSFLARPGQMVALVGQTGCGKSTITNLLYRFYDVQAGAVSVDGHDLRTLDPRWYRRQVAIVPQEPVVFNTSFRDNLLYGAPHATDAEILAAAQDAELTGVLDRLSHGLDTVLGDEGVRISTGEKQRLCIARALLARPAIIILDEATSSLDPMSETLIQRALQRVMRGRTSFVIAHRLSTIMGADLILVLDRGRILEHGRHAELMQRDGSHYRYLFETQTLSESSRPAEPVATRPLVEAIGRKEPEELEA